MFNRSRRNLARWFMLSMGGVLVVFAAAVYYLEVAERLETLDHNLYKKTKAIASIIHYRQGQVDLSEVPWLVHQGLPPSSDLTYVRWYSPEGRLEKFVGPAPEPAVGLGQTDFQTLKPLDSHRPWLRQLTLPILRQGEVIGYLQVAIALAPVQSALEQFRLSLSLGVPLALSVIGLSGWWLGGLAMQPIRQAYEQLQRFTADASHELRAPLAAILSNAQVGLMTPVEHGAQQQLRFEKIVATAKSMSSLVDNLLFLARHEGKLPPDSLREVDLVKLLLGLVESHQEAMALKSLILTTELPDRPVGVRGDPALLGQVVGNLLSNAWKYTPAGGRVHVQLGLQPRRALLQVSDSGIGIPAADLPHIFTRFYRVDVVRSRQTGGFGLGLAIAQQIIEAHGGHLSATSQVGQGSTFQIELPLAGPMPNRGS